MASSGRPLPRAEDVVGLLEAMGVDPSHEIWSPVGEPEYESFEDLVEVTTRRLCLDPGRADEVARALARARGRRPVGRAQIVALDLFTIWWSGTA